jgi:hypothetical protein
MTQKTKRELKRDLEEIADTTTDTPTELIAEMPLWMADEPELSEHLSTRGFVVEREERVHDNGYRDVLLHTTPSANDVFHQIAWHWGGPTAPKEAVRVRFDETRREAVLEAAEYPVVYEQPSLPEEPVTVVEGDGWEAVAEADLVAENMVLRRSTAKQAGYEIIGEAPPIPDRDTYDLVEVDAPAVPYSERATR